MNKNFVGLFLLALALTTNAIPAVPCWTPLHQAAQDGNVDQVRNLIQQNPTDVNRPDNGGKTPLHVATWQDKTNCITPLLQHGAKVNAKNNRDWTPLHFAALWGNKNCVRLLLQSGAELNAKSIDGSTPLHCVVLFGHLECAEILLQSGANFEEKNDAGKTAKDIAQEKAHEDIAKLIEDYENLQDIKEPEVK